MIPPIFISSYLTQGTCNKSDEKFIYGSSDIWSDGKYAFISQASGGRYNERSEWSITLYTVTQ